MQISIFDEITVDGFCGGGGWSTGFELGIGRPVDIGINHDAAAIALHKKNHPFTEHYQTNIFEVDPVEACRGRPVGWAHFSPDCKHFSRAKGAKPVNKQIRSLAWVVVQWAAAVKPRIISMENVPEFLGWGPCIALRGPHGRVMKMVDGKAVEAEPGENVPKHLRLLTPDPKRKGKTFAQFVGHLRKLGYEVEWNELTASDYGAPTSRKRFFLLARRDKRPIIWPAPTHGNPKSPAVQAGKLKPWRTAAEIIDWTIPCPSIFERKKPLADNTLKRISKGLQKFVLDNPEPFVVHYKFANDPESVNRPLSTITAVNSHFVVTPTLIQYHTEQSGKEHRGQSVESPLQTVDAANRYGLVAATIIQFNNHCDGVDIQKPLPTITAQSNHFAEVRAILIKYYSGDGCQPVDRPLDTITTRDRFGLVTVHGVDYQIVDIGLRMLTPRELYNAQGFPPDYEIEVDCYGNAYPKKEQVARCGNSVPPPFATALVRANWPEACGKEINTMAALNDAWAV